MPLGVNSDRIHNALVAAAKNGRFYARAINAGTGLVATDTSVIVPPNDVTAGETGASFNIGTNKRAGVDDRTSWAWELRVNFTKAVSCELFEEDLTNKPLLVSRDAANGYTRQVVIHLRSATYKHPPEQQATQGTRVVFKFEATLSPL